MLVVSAIPRAHTWGAATTSTPRTICIAITSAAATEIASDCDKEKLIPKTSFDPIAGVAARPNVIPDVRVPATAADGIPDIPKVSPAE
jgi:hypothetical protein